MELQSNATGPFIWFFVFFLWNGRGLPWCFQKGKDTHYCEGKDHFGGGPLRVKDFGLKVIPSDKQAYFTSPRKRSLICNKYKMLEALGEVGSNEAFPKSLNPTFCVPMPLLSPRRKMGNSRSRSVPPFSSFEKLLTSSSGCVVANSGSCLQERKLSFKAEIFWGKEMQNVTFLGGTRQPKAQGPIEEEKGASSLNQSCSWGGPEGVEVRECLQHRGSHFQVLTSTPLSMVKGWVLEGASVLSSSPLSPIFSLRFPDPSVPFSPPAPSPPPQPFIFVDLLF